MLILLLATWASVVSAQEPLRDSDDAKGALPLYTVEVIVFAYTENVSVGTEIFIHDAPTDDVQFDEYGNPVYTDGAIPEYGDAVRDDSRDAADREAWVVVPGLVDLSRPGGRNSPAHRLVLLEEDELELSNIIDRFRRLDVYETLMHFGWTQPAYPEEETPPIELQLFGTPPPGLAGTLTLYLGRFLHLVVDVALDAPAQFEEEVVADEDFYSFGDERPQYDDLRYQRNLPVRFRIQEDRIVKNGELRYFDHPKFGLLAKVTRIEKTNYGETDTGTP